MTEPVCTPDASWTRQRLRVPRDDRSVYASPDLCSALGAAQENSSAFSSAKCDIQGRTLLRLRQWSRAQVVAAACDYTSRLIDSPIEVPQFNLVFAGGHQPSMFHPGVWVKNFALHYFATQSAGIGLNLVIDNDTFSTTRIRVPAGDRNHPSVETEPFDEESPRQPWEGANIQNETLFRSFPDRVCQRMDHWGIAPLVADLWKNAVGHLDRSRQISDCLTAARHGLERDWGVNNLELPISELCQLDPFLWFAGHILAQLPEFHAIHNEALLQYRQVNRVRSRTHPVADLTVRDEWLEAPFWVWRSGDQERKRVYAKQLSREIVLSDGENEFCRFPLAPDMDACCAVEAMKELTSQGIHLRTRALTTTLFARLCLADLFVHGIGGAKYDEMTDRIISRFYKISPPDFLTLSATLHLPLGEAHQVAEEEARRLRMLLRDRVYNPQRYLDAPDQPDLQQLMREKQQLIDEQNRLNAESRSPQQRRNERRTNFLRFRRLQELNHQMADSTTRQFNMIREDLQRVEQRLQANAILQNREFAYCLYPADEIRAFMASMGQMISAS